MSVAACIAAGAFTAPLFAQDECTSATVLQLDVPTPFSTLTATASAGVPVDTNCAASALLWTATTPDIWFKWTAPANGLATFNACSSDLGAIDTSLVLYKGLCGSMVQIACNGDAPHNSNATCNPTDAKISSVMVTEGSVYYLRVGGIDSEFGVARGSGQIQVSLSRIAAWGDNTFNQCTIPSTIGIPSKVSGGSNHVFAIRADGTLVGWGSNLLGQLNVPATVTTVRDVSAGQTFTVAVRTNGTLAGWGSNTSNRATPPATVTDAISIAAGGFHGLALRATGTVVAWGAGLTNTGLANNYGQSIVPAGLSNVTGISAGFYHSVAVRSDGFVNAWGAGAAPTPTTNNFGQSIVPAGLASVTKVACGWHHTLALRADGTVAAWGAGTVNNNANPNWGQSIVPADLAGVIDVAGGQYFSLALRSNGTVAAWGRNVDREREVPTWTGPLAALTTVGASALAIYDGCPEDPLSTADCVDNCPDDPNKREPGVCGCGVPDVDTDGDTVLDCLDACPSDPTLTAKLIYFADADGDGFGDAATQVLSCQHTPPAGSVANSSDCNDALLTYADSDNDGFGAGVPVACGLATNTDCNDSVAAINPGATELCDALNVDENCNGLADNLDAGALETSKSNFFADLDNDNWSLATASRFCDSPSPSYRSTPSSPADCNDADAAINPGAAERCDAGDVDENCNGTADNSDPGALESTKTSFFGDLDNDLFTVANASRFCDRPSGYFQTASALADCNDADATVYPNAVENCANRGVDNDCDGTANSDAEAIDATTYYADNDNDTYGAGAVVKSCVSLASHVLNNLDCNDSDATAFPGGTETCANHGVDNNCNGVANDPTESPDARTYYADIDGDGFGNAAAPIPSCANTPAAGQANNSTDCDDTRVLYPDADQDGYGSSTRVACGIAVTGDCNDTNAAVNPGATESCNQIDDNCNGVVDDSVVFNNYYRDTDADGFGDANGTPVSSCSPVVRHVTNNLDCDDTRVLYADADGDGRGAGAPAPCGVPTNDDGCPNNAQLFAPATYYRDADNDGFGAAAVSVSTCNQGIPTGYVTNSADCNDAARLYADNDNDTFGAGAPVACGVTSNTDCNDAVATINPAAPELCDPNNVDENCNDFADNLDPTTLSSSKSNFYADIDNDAFTLGVASRFCDQPTGYRTTATIQVDCNDNNAAINPGANEVCDANNTDENCNGIADNNDPTATFASRTNFWADNDNDTYTLANAARFCDQPTGYRTAASAQADCNDANAAINPGATEVCDANNLDENCNNLADNNDPGASNATKTNFWADLDGDTYTSATAARFCDRPTGYLTAASTQADCNDNSAAINPGATEICDANNTDENCNSLADNADPGAADAGRTTYYVDADNDTYTLSTSARLCDAQAGYRLTLSNPVDCNDNNAAVNPGATEVCDASNIDENCNNLADDADATVSAASKSNFYADLDADNFTLANAVRFCDEPVRHRAAPSALIDCNDNNAAINPGASEICDPTNTDEDCDSLADDADFSTLPATKSNFYADIDNDTYTLATVSRFCDQPAGYRTAASALADCNDAVAAINPGATEVCDANNVDENCNSLADNSDSGVLDSTRTNFWADSDDDTYTVVTASRFCDQPAGYRVAASPQADCNDAVASINPGASEICDANDVDENCNNLADNNDPGALLASKSDFWPDLDSDTYTADVVGRFCDQPALHSAARSPVVDCNDADAAINPGATEICDAGDTDEDCDTLADNADSSAADAGKTDFWADLDNDTYTAAGVSRFCDQPAGFVTAASALADCNDAIAAINPAATEVCDAVNTDENCSGAADDADAAVLESTKTNFWADLDNDTYTVDVASRFCDQPALHRIAVSNDVDCDDARADVHPESDEICDAANTDENCNGAADDADLLALDATKTNFWADIDGDSFTVAAAARFCDQPAGFVTSASALVDCNDGVAAINPGMTELCDSADIDENCTGTADNADAGALESTKTDFWADLDTDAYTVAEASRFCDQPAGFVTAASTLVDCNDAVATINPGMTELCDASNIDEDCNNLADDADAGALESTKTDFWLDADGDTYTVAAASRFCDQPALYLAAVSAEIDCNDGDAAINPGMVELCDASNVDEDCNNLADDADAGALESTKTDFWLDADSDTYTVAEVSRFCDQPALYLAAVSAEIDCNDGVAAINPGKTELCDASDVDENCNNLADDADAGALESTKTDFWADLDADSYTVAAASRFCDQPAGFVTAASTLVDCNDGIATINPGMTELCDASNIDEDCNNLADDADAGALESTKTDFWADLDDDAYTVAAISRFCDQPALYRAAVSAEIDCNDAVAVINPGMPEICDSADTDENCNGLADNADIAALEATKTGYFADFDNDTYTVAAAASFCDRPTLYRDAASHLIDCNDGDAAINPGMPEICDALDTDEDCNLRADNADLFALDATKTDFWADLDADGFTVSGATRFCDIVAGYMVAATAGVDCDDAAALTYPGAVELCATTTVDNNCDGTIDDVDVGAADKVDYWRDADLDSFTTAETERFCPGTTNSGYLPAPSLLVDCDDAANMTYPGAEENCGNLGIDNDCNGVNAESESVDLVTFYADSDADGAGDPDVTAQRCVVPAGYVGVAGDECPANGQLVVKASYYLDSDADGEGDPAFPILSCDSTPPTGYSASSGDGCPADPAKIAPGTCGCGVADVDSDGDLVLDCVDNCPSVSNADQLNCDTDAFGNACDSDDDNDAIADHNDAYACDAAKSDLDAGYSAAEMTAFLATATSVTVDATGMDIAQFRVIVALADRVASGGLGGTFTLDSRFTVAELAVLLGKAAPPTGFVGGANITIDALGMSAEQLDEVIAQIGRVTTIVELSLDASFTAAEIATLVSRTAAGEATILVTDMTREQLLASVSGPNTVFVRGHLEIDASFTAEQIARIVGSALAGQTTFDVDTSGMSAAQQGALLSTASLIIDADAAVAAGGTFTVYVDVSGLPIRAVGIQASVSFDPTKLEFVATEPISGVDFPWAIYLQQNADNVRFSTGIDLGGSLTGILEGNVARLTFRAIEPLCGATSLVWLTPTGFDNTITSAATATENSAPIPFTAINRARVVDLNSVAFANVPAANFSVPTDAGSVFGAHIADPQVSASNNCGAIPVDMVVQYPAESGLPTGSSWPSAFPIGTTSVTWSMVDPLGAVHSVSRTVEVRDHQVIVLDVHLDGVIANQLFTLPIRLQLDGEQPIITAVTFQGGIGQVREVNVPVRTGYTCMTAKDALHTLAAALPVQISGARYVTNGAFHLVGGDSNDDNIVDVIDFGGLVADYGAGKDANSRSNFNRDGFVTNADLAFIAIHFLRRGESCSAGFDGDAPRSRITVKELRRMGLGEFEIADLNGDGWIDATDIALAAQGVMPRGTAPRASEPRDANATRW